MNTSQLIKLLKKLEFGASGRPRELSFVIYDNEKINGKFLCEPIIEFDSSGDECAGAELCLRLIN